MSTSTSIPSVMVDRERSFYDNLINDSAQAVTTANQSKDRFVSIMTRQWRSDLPNEVWRAIQKGKELHSWHGVTHLKDPFVMTMYPQVIWEFKPKTIIELGTFTGSCAHWLATVCDGLDLDPSVKVYTLDHTPELRDRSLVNPRLEFLIGNLMTPELALPVDLLKSLPHPWFFMDDAHTNVNCVLEYLDKEGFQPGDYVVIEDTHINIPNFYGEAKYKREDWIKADHVRPFLEQHAERYLVDTKYCDVYGYNVTYNWNSFLKVV